MIDLWSVTIGQMATMTEAARTLPNEDLRIVDFAPHEPGYRRAQADGFALLALLRDLDRALESTPAALSCGRLPEEVLSDDRQQDIEYAMRAHAMTKGSIHALRILRAQGGLGRIADVLEAGTACLRIWTRLDDEQRAGIVHGWNDAALAA